MESIKADVILGRLDTIAAQLNARIDGLNSRHDSVDVKLAAAQAANEAEHRTTREQIKTARAEWSAELHRAIASQTWRMFMALTGVVVATAAITAYAVRFAT